MFLFLAKSASKLKKLKNQDFSKGVSPWVWQKKIGQENVFDKNLKRKKAFLVSKITKLKKLKIWYFSKGVGPKFEFLPSLIEKEK